MRHRGCRKNGRADGCGAESSQITGLGEMRTDRPACTVGSGRRQTSDAQRRLSAGGPFRAPLLSGKKASDTQASVSKAKIPAYLCCFGVCAEDRNTHGAISRSASTERQGGSVIHSDTEIDHFGGLSASPAVRNWHAIRCRRNSYHEASRSPRPAMFGIRRLRPGPSGSRTSGRGNGSARYGLIAGSGICGFRFPVSAWLRF